MNNKALTAQEIHLKYLSIKEIAFSCGFSNVSHFISLYRKKGSFTPIENRKIHYKDEKLKRKE